MIAPETMNHPDRKKFLLEVLSGESRGEVFRVTGPTATVGRSASNEIQLPDRAMSRKHLKISALNKGWLVQDLWSRNGTRLNGKALRPGQATLVKEGDRLTIGTTSFCIKEPQHPERRDTAHEDTERLSPALIPLKDFYEDRPRSYIKNVELINCLSEALMGSLKLSDIFERLADYLFDVFKRIGRVAILRKHPETGLPEELIVRTREDLPEAWSGYSRTIVEEVFASGQSQFILDFDEHDKTRLSESQKLIRSYMCVPLISRSSVRGVIYVDSLEYSRGFRQEDLFLLSALSSPAAMAIENATLVADLEKMVDVKTRALQEVGNRLKTSEIRYKAIFNNMNSGAVVLKETEEGGDFQILELNRAALRIEGVENKDHLSGSLLSQALPFSGECGLMDACLRVARGGEAESLVISIPGEDEGFQAFRDCYLYRLPTKEVVMLYEDITEKIMLDKEQKELQMQLYNSQKLESIGLIAGGVAHNFRNILQAVYGNVEYLEMLYGEQPEIKEIASNIAESVEKGSDMTRDLLHFSKRSRASDFNDCVDMGEVIEKTCNMIARLLDQRITLEKKTGPGLTVRGNASLLSQVLMNLITNARDAMTGEGRILVEGKRKGPHVICRVSDTGTGMDAETLKRIFDPFFTLKEVGKGTGLGLSTSRGIISQHGGSVTVDSAPGKGSTFEITLPFEDAGRFADKDKIPVRSLGNNEKILIVDDDEAVLNSMALLVERLGYMPLKVNRAVEALRRYPVWNPDLVLIDRNMPEMDGLSCTQEILRMDPDAKVVIISGYHDVGPDGIDEDVRRVIRGYLTKPCQIRELAGTISQALS